MRPRICTLCGEPLGKNFRAVSNMRGCRGGKVHDECLEYYRNNTSVVPKSNRNIHITKAWHIRIMETLNGY